MIQEVGRVARIVGLITAVSLAGCRQSQGPATDGQPATQTAGRGTAASPAFCSAIDRIVEAEGQSFAPLRAETRGADLWSGAIVPPGLEACNVIGASRAGAQYICWGPTVPDRAGLSQLQPTFNATAERLDACLGVGAAGAGRFNRGTALSFAGGERLAVWRDGHASPAAGLTLRIEEDWSTGAYTLSLSAVTLR